MWEIESVIVQGERKRKKRKWWERNERRGKRTKRTHRPIVPEGRQPERRPLICSSNIREALLVGWFAGFVGRSVRSWLGGCLLILLCCASWHPTAAGIRQRSVWREKDATVIVKYASSGDTEEDESRKKRGGSKRNIQEKGKTKGKGIGSRYEAMALGEANDTSLGNFNFAEITVGLIRIKRSRADTQNLENILKFQFAVQASATSDVTGFVANAVPFLPHIWRSVIRRICIPINLDLYRGYHCFYILVYLRDCYRC